jgi:hypothetical protein
MARQSVKEPYEAERKFLAEEARHRSLVLFLGAGVSRDAELPNWKSLVVPLGKDLKLETSTDPLGHRLNLAADQLLSTGFHSRLLHEVREDLKAISNTTEYHAILTRLRKDFPSARL